MKYLKMFSFLVLVCLYSISSTILANSSALWAKSVTSGSDTSRFYDTTMDNSGNVYAVGLINGSGSYNFGNGVSVSGAYSSDKNVLLVKYNAEGEAQWAKTVTVASDYSLFSSVAVDNNGNIYAVGYLNGTDPYDFGASVTVNGTVSTGSSLVLVKYNSSGVAQWAKSVTTGPDASLYNSVTVDGSNNVYVTGTIFGDSTYSFGNGVTVNGAYNGGYNMVLVKYDSKGDAQWAKSVTTGSDISFYNSVTVDGSNNVYVCGSIEGNSQFGLGNSVTVQGTYASGENLLIAKYNSSGDAQWAKSVTSGSGSSSLLSLAICDDGNIYAVGYIDGPSTFGIGSGITFSAPSSVGTYTSSVAIVKYDSSGVPLWANSIESGPDSVSRFLAVDLDSSGNAYAAGSINGMNTFGFGNGVNVTGPVNDDNVLLVKYSSAGNPLWGKSILAGSAGSAFRAVIANNEVIYTAGRIYGSGDYGFGDGVDVTGAASSSNNIILVKYSDIPPVVSSGNTLKVKLWPILGGLLLVLQ